MSCRATFSFLKGPCLDQVISHEFAADATVADMKGHLLHAHRAFDADSQALVLVWDEQALKLTNDAQAVATLGVSCNITVNVIKKAASQPAAAAPAIVKSHLQPPTPAAPAPAPPLSGTTLSSSAAAHIPHPPLPRPSLSSLQAAPPARFAALPETVKHGSRVRIEGLLVKAELNGLTGTVQSTCIQSSGRCTVRTDCDASLLSIRLANLLVISEDDVLQAAASVNSGAAHATDLGAICHGLQAPSAGPAVAAPSPTQPAAELQRGVRVIISGLVAKPEMNDCTGVICDAFNAQSGRWTVQIDSSPQSRGSFRPVNLTPIPPLDQAKEWLDEHGRQCPKCINYATQCPKGHSLIPVPDGALQAHRAALCRMCHRLATPPLLFCSVKACCGGCIHIYHNYTECLRFMLLRYVVCSSCVGAWSLASVPCSAGDDMTAVVSGLAAVVFKVSPFSL
jgi:hypothetical protein